MKYRYAVCMFVAALVLQTTLTNIISIFGAVPNLILCLVVVFSFLYDENNYGIVLGVAFGLLYDICFSEYVGIAALAYLVISLAIMLVNFVMNKESVFSVIIVSVGATALHSLMYWSIMAMLGSSYGFVYAMRNLPFYALYNTAVVTGLYSLMIKKVIRHHNDRYYK
ncbi:MAG: rod shape-determining protein MreD [Clostridiales bacterium]|nr:rod shape-determining protein MreD [Clostridiales bacterium]